MNSVELLNKPYLGRPDKRTLVKQIHQQSHTYGPLLLYNMVPMLANVANHFRVDNNVTRFGEILPL